MTINLMFLQFVGVCLAQQTLASELIGRLRRKMDVQHSENDDYHEIGVNRRQSGGSENPRGGMKNEGISGASQQKQKNTELLLGSAVSATYNIVLQVRISQVWEVV